MIVCVCVCVCVCINGVYRVYSQLFVELIMGQCEK